MIVIKYSNYDAPEPGTIDLGKLVHSGTLGGERVAVEHQLLELGESGFFVLAESNASTVDGAAPPLLNFAVVRFGSRDIL